ncbi:hypothetical protein [Legionella sp.]|uniref:hypothetical protein n=1 Tax=Legionella sp. TaxID=459 RepID=UPI0032207D90
MKNPASFFAAMKKDYASLEHFRNPDNPFAVERAKKTIELIFAAPYLPDDCPKELKENIEHQAKASNNLLAEIVDCNLGAQLKVAQALLEEQTQKFNSYAELYKKGLVSDSQVLDQLVQESSKTADLVYQLVENLNAQKKEILSMAKSAAALKQERRKEKDYSPEGDTDEILETSLTIRP